MQSTTTAPVQVPALVPQWNLGAIVLKEQQLPAVQQALDALNFETMPTADIVRLGHDAEQQLHHTLDGFLARLDAKTAVHVFTLFDRLQQGVNDAKLPDVLKKVQRGTVPSLFARLIGVVRGKVFLQKLANDTYEEIRGLIVGRTKTLADVMGKLERELQVEMARLVTELQALDKLKVAYRQHFSDFTIAAGLTRAFFEKARTYVEAEAAKIGDSTDAESQAHLQELRDKLQLLESRALALEGTYTRLPADHLVIQQLEQAGVGTLQETATTAAARFASIKMTLLAVHGAFAVKGVQQLGQRQADMDRQLAQVRGSLMKEVVTTSANAPGDNRLAQADQIAKIIAEAQEVRQIVEAARKSNQEKFAQARQKFEESRRALVALPK